MAHTRACPYCAELIEPTAMRCPFCRSDLPAAAPRSVGSWPCVNCGAFNSGGSVCPSCGTMRAGAPPQPYYAPQPAYRPQKAPSSDTALTLGIISIAGGFLCGFLLGPVAWHYGSKAEGECGAMGIPVDTNARTGKILGIISTVLMILGVLAVGFIIAAMAIAEGTRA